MSNMFGVCPEEHLQIWSSPVIIAKCSYLICQMHFWFKVCHLKASSLHQSKQNQFTSKGVSKMKAYVHLFYKYI